MAGGTGSRFWPVASTLRPKQFIDIMGTGESMLQATFRRMEGVVPRENIIIVTSANDAGTVRDQLPGLDTFQVLGEPMRRGTGPCIAYAAARIAARSPHANIIVTPSDHAIFGRDAYTSDLQQALDTASGSKRIVTIGAQPTEPNTKYGYIQYTTDQSDTETPRLHKVVTFTEKPPLEMARKFIATGEFLWNTGIIATRLDTLLEAYRRHLPAVHNLFFDRRAQQSDEKRYSTCEAVSIDRGILEKADNVHVLAATFAWSDVETWDSLFDTCPKNTDNNVILGGKVFTYDVHNTIIHMPDTAHTLVVDGLDGYIVAASEETLMICRRERGDQILKFRSDVRIQKLRQSGEQQ